MKRLVLQKVLLFCASWLFALPLLADEVAYSLSQVTRTLTLDATCSRPDTITPFAGVASVCGLSIDATVVQPSARSFVRIILEDVNGKNYLVAETSRMFNDTSTVVWTNYGEESLLLPSAVQPARLRVMVKDATLHLTGIRLQESATQGGVMPLAVSAPTNRQAQRRQQMEQRVGKINAYNHKNKLPWLAGVTEVSLLPYEERKEMMQLFGDGDDTGGFEFYKGGIFVTGGAYQGTVVHPFEGEPYSPANPNSPFVNEFDWRNRHGKNWITPAKIQVGLTCWAFAATSGVEAYINLYYNRLKNYDLSEGQLVCQQNIKWETDRGHFVSSALNYIKREGIVKESCCPFFFPDESAYSMCESPTERIKINGWEDKIRSIEDSIINAHDSIMQKIVIHSPAMVSVERYLYDENGNFKQDEDGNLERHGHSLLLVGYKTLIAGDTICSDIFPPDSTIISIIEAGTPWVGKCAWALKNSYGTDWGDDGYCYMVLFDDSLYHYSWDEAKIITGKIYSQMYTDNHIRCADDDGDGYYYWGIGPKPASCPVWAPDEPDGDDSDYTKGPLNHYGYCKDLNPNYRDTIFIQDAQTWNERKYLHAHVVVCENAQLTVKKRVDCYNGVSFTIRDGGKLIVDGGTINNVLIKPRSGGAVVVENNGGINSRDNKNFVVPIGATLDLNYGTIK